jgi:EAL domain-containing protein (putative c-di-GMP-specific phosphodiesterase class I)
MEEETRRRLETIRELRHDFRQRRLQLWYQPQIELATGRLVVMEALLRWPAEQGFRHLPSVFIPLTESSGLISEIGAWALEQACVDLAVLQSHGSAAPPRVSVNVSQLQFRSATFVPQVAAAIERHRLEPDQLELEITETVAMDEPRVVIATLNALRKLGVRLSIDDFGMGYSSLTYLRHLPVHVLKIDRTFVNEIADGTGILAEAILRLGNQLGLEVVAEGVETDEQHAFLCAHRCEYAQGYRYAKPMPLPQLKHWLGVGHQDPPAMNATQA